VAEWPNVPDSKSGVPQGTVGSNPTLSANLLALYLGADSNSQAFILTAATISDAVPEPLVNSKLERSDWVDMQLAKSFMQDTKRSMPASFVVAWVIAAVLYKVAPPLLLVIWLLLSNLVILFRYLVVLQYQTTLQCVSGEALRTFLRRYDFLWVASGVLWGASTLLFFGHASGFEQLICALILVAVSCFSVYCYASRLKCYFAFANALCGTSLVLFVYCMLFDAFAYSLVDSVGLVLLTVVFHVMLRYFAIGFHDLQQHSLQLQFDNSMLIKSLTAKSAAALEAVENKNRFIASAAHDLRQPVHALNLYASWLVDEPELGPQVAPQIVRCTNAVNELFNSLFDFSGLNANAPEVHPQQVDLGELLLDLKHQYAPLALENGLQLRLHNASISTVSDPVLLKRLLGNLISNALKNTRRGGVLLALRQRGGRWRIEVWDTGVGIEARFQEAIFKEFYRVPRPGTEEGFGLGLAIASRLGQLLGHRLHMKSRVGRGSVFWIEQQGDSLSALSKGMS
jgi:signal transduction histidine kinase